MNTKTLIRWAGLAALVAGIIFVVVQPLHPPDVLASVITFRWRIVHYVSTAMCFLTLLGITGLYARQSCSSRLHRQRRPRYFQQNRTG